MVMVLGRCAPVPSHMGKAALSVLNIFDHGVADLLAGNEIDRPRNAITVTHNLHRFFGDFEVFFKPNRSIDSPLPRLLALHRAITHIIRLSVAGAYIGKILDDLEKKVIRADGSTELSHAVTLKLGGCLDGTIYV
ncbi:hypothetical protein QBC36DRAFT_389382 [Triangularia setosa]|uniref:HNH nuclease domain-containing protein n=1 Tax=Triangularia setosa TaxID=2587417 RepID=A0AAN6W2Q7_9PEZI|nr:hypothetical protein QBC36DRAFT_389382 [Podospora setosa]